MGRSSSLAGGMALALLAACKQFYDLDDTRVVGDGPDQDMDGIADALDNCPTIANPTQHDEDLDTHGDACDNCPLISNGDQTDLGEPAGQADGVGDACDPNPRAPGDCLLIFDSFEDNATFGEHWIALKGSVDSTGKGFVEVNGTMLSSRFRDSILDIQATGTANLGDASSIGVVSNARQEADGHMCAAARETGGYTAHAQIQPAGDPPPMPIEATALDKLSAPPVGDVFVLRIADDGRVGTPNIVCRVDYGFAVGVSRAAIGNVAAPETRGGAGVRATGVTARLQAIALYDVTAPCTSIRR